MHRPIFLALALGALLPRAAPAAEPVVYGPDGAPTVVQNKLYTMTGRTELGLSAALAVNGALVDHYGGILQLTHHPNEWFDFGGELAANYTALSGLGDQVRSNLPPRPAGTFEDEIAGVAQLRAGAFALARLAPFYGKLNLASEVKLHFQAFGMVGAGGGLYHHESVNLCQQSGAAQCSSRFLTSDAVHPTGLLGLGFRFYFNDRWSLRTELRTYLFPDSYVVQADLSNPSSNKGDKSYLGVLATFAAGVSTLF